MKPFYINCIFHNDTNPSLRINFDRTFKCYGCGITGICENYEILQNKYDRQLEKYLESIGQLRFLEM